MHTMLFYQKPVVLNRDTHRHLKLRAVPSYAYAADTNSVPLNGSEFAAAARHFPILFIPDANKEPTPIALLGLRRDENLFVEADGSWSCSYIPAFVRRYPYLLAEKGVPDDFAVCIDEKFPGFTTEEGEPMFAEDGTETPVLKLAIEFLNVYQADALRTQQFSAELKRLDLLIAQVINVSPRNGNPFKMEGFSVVDEARLAKLTDKQAGDLLRKGYMGWIYAHLLSTRNVPDLSARLDPRLESGKTA